MMKNNGFNLDKGELITSEKPNVLGVFFEVFKSFVFGLFFVYYVILSFLYDEDGNKNGAMYDSLIGYIFPLIGVGVLIVFIIHVFKFLDLKRRTYEIYQNIITYNEGFISKNYSLLPFENLTDSGVTQTMIEKIFGLYDIKISCQGSKHEILFKNIKNGKQMSDKLDELISNKEEKIESHSSHVSTGGKVLKKTAEKRHLIDEGLNYDQVYTKSFHIDYKRVVKFPLIIFLSSGFLAIVFLLSSFVLGAFLSESSFFVVTLILFGLVPILGLISFLALFSCVGGYIKQRATKYYVGQKNIQYKYNFLSSREVEFSSDKVTGVLIARSFFDEWFNTMSVGFWSIGASSTLVFANIKKEDGTIESIVSKFGILREDELFAIDPKFSPVEYFKSFLPLFVLVSLVSILFSSALVFVHPLIPVGLFVLLCLFFGLNYLYNKERYKRTKLIFCKSFVYYQTGWLFKKFYYAKYQDIKDISTVRYPFSSEGRIKFNIAGERVMHSKQSGKRIISNSFTIDFVPNIKEKDELIDYILQKRPTKNEIATINSSSILESIGKPVLSVKPDLKNAVMPVVAMLILFDLLISLPILSIGFSGVMFAVLVFVILLNVLVILSVYLPVKMTTYIMDDYRILSKSGVFFKKQTSVIYDKIDFINNNQGFLNKIFKNGNVLVNTVGSSRTELAIKNISSYKQFYEQLKNKYESV